MIITKELTKSITWSITFVDPDCERLITDGTPSWGVMYGAEHEIYIDKSLDTQTKYKTLIHELTHAFIFDTQAKEDDLYTEEELCNFVSLYGYLIVDLAEEIMNEYLEGKGN